MNHLLVMPRIVDKSSEWYMFPLGLPYVSSSLKKHGFSVFTLNLNHIDGDIEDILQDEIEKNNIDIIETGGISSQYNTIKHIVSAAKKIKKDIVTVVGGGIISSEPKVAMEALEFADYGIIGEGEITCCKLSEALIGKKEISKVNGLIYKSENCFIQTPIRSEIEELDSIPFPDYEGFEYEKIVDIGANFIGMNETNTVTMISSRSCPFQCTFCFHTNGMRYRQRSLDNFFQELDMLVLKYGIKYIYIADELFSYDIKRIEEFCQRIKKYNIKWWAQFRVCDITSELIQFVKDANCAIMAFGLESADNRILKSMKKYITIEQIEKALKLVYDAGITIQGNFIFGDIEETVETATNTLKWWEEHIHYGINLNFIAIYPGTELYKYACGKGIISDEIEYLKQGCLGINVSKMSQDERRWLSEQIMKTPNKEPNKVKNINIDYANKTISLTAYCNSCEQENTWEDIRFFSRNTLTCKLCGLRHNVLIPDEIVSKCDVRINEILIKHKRIAFWGINDFFSDFSRRLDVIKDENIYFIDDTKMKQGCTISGKLIYSSDIIVKRDIGVVIVAVPTIFSIIEEKVKSIFPNVKVIVSIQDLI